MYNVMPLMLACIGMNIKHNSGANHIISLPVSCYLSLSLLLVILQYLVPDSQSIMLESIRVLGNLTRDKSVRDLISEMRSKK